jgi:hypothetical protein
MEAVGKDDVVDMTAQERRSQQDHKEQEENILQEFENILVQVKKTPKLWCLDRMGFLWEFCSFVERSPEFPHQRGDNTTDLTLQVNDHELRFTRGYGKALASCQDSLTLAQSPILAVLSAGGTFLRKFILAAGLRKMLSLWHWLLLMVMASVFIPNWTTAKLQRGDKIHFNLFTSIKYRVTNESPLMPALFVYKLFHVGRDFENLPNVLTNCCLACSSKPSELSANCEPIDDKIVIDPCKHNPPTHI